MAHVHYPGLTVIPTGYLRVLVVLSPEVLPPDSAAVSTIPCFVLTIIGQWDAILLYQASLLQLLLSLIGRETPTSSTWLLSHDDSARVTRRRPTCTVSTSFLVLVKLYL